MLKNSHLVILERAFSYLIRHHLDSGELSPEACLGVIRELSALPAVKESLVRISLERFSSSGDAWWIQACTHPEANIGHEFSVNQGLTGWMLRTRRNALFEGEKQHLPEGVLSTPGYEKTESAFLYAITVDGKKVGCLCVVSDQTNAISKELATDLYRLGHLIDIVLSRKEGFPRPEQAKSLFLPAQMAADRGDLIDCLADRLPQHFRWANYWRWDDARDCLCPSQVSQELKLRGSTWLSELQKGQGFVGACAERNELICEPIVEDGLGRSTGIRTPLSEIVPGKKFRSILVCPVSDSDRFHGVLAILSETSNFFTQGDEGDLREICREMAVFLRNRDEKRKASLLRETRRALDDTLYKPISPTQYWPLLESILRKLIEAQVCVFASLWVRRQSELDSYTCKSVASDGTAQVRGVTLDMASCKALHAVLACESGSRAVSRLPTSMATLGLVPSDLDTVWIEKYAFDPSQGSHPTLLALVGQKKRTIYSDPFGKRGFEDLMGQVYYSVFATTRAILAEHDANHLRRQEAWFMASETHELKQPMATIRQAVGSISEIIQDRDPRIKDVTEEVMRKLDEAEFKIENMIYREWHVTSRNKTADPAQEAPGKEDICLNDFTSGLVAEAKSWYPEHKVVFHLSGEGAYNPSSGLKWWIKGKPRWLRVALRNVLDNAVKFGRNQPVEVRLKREREGAVLLEVEDRGIGIPAAEVRAIFEPGFRSSHSRRESVTGSQIGLSITKDILEENGWAIWATSEINKGSVFTIKIPKDLVREAKR